MTVDRLSAAQQILCCRTSSRITLYHVATPTPPRSFHYSHYRPDDTGGAAHSCAAGHTTYDKDYLIGIKMKEFFIQTDASNIAVGGMLFEIDKRKTNYCLLSWLSKTVAKSQKSWSAKMMMLVGKNDDWSAKMMMNISIV